MEGSQLLKLGLLWGAATLFLVACSPPERPVDSVVLVTLDTLRADHLGCYGYPRPTTPFLDGLAKRGAWFSNAVATSSHTAPSHASLLTSRYPEQHGVRLNGQGFGPDTVTIASAFRAQGFATAGFTSVRFLQPLSSGFGHFDARTPEVNRSRPAHQTVDSAIQWLEEQDPTQRYFLWIHLYDAHETDARSHVSHPDLEAMRRDSRRRGAALSEFLVREHGVESAFDPEVLEEYNRYDAQVAFMDRQLARLHEAVTTGAPDQKVLWAVTADHGEGLGSHGYDGHDKHLYREQLRVPLILAGAARAGRIDRLVRHVDLLPTLAELTGIEDGLPPDLEGRSLATLLESPQGDWPIEFAFAQRRPASPGHVKIGPPGQRLYAVQGTRYKYIHDSEGRHELYDLREDPLELHNLAAAASPPRERLAAWLETTLRRLEDGSHPVDDAVVDDEILRELKALGYVD